MLGSAKSKATNDNMIFFWNFTFDNSQIPLFKFSKLLDSTVKLANIVN